MSLMPLSQWPAPLLRRWLALPGTGFGCLLIGTVSCIVLRDRVMFYLSAAICAVCLAKAVHFYRLVCRREYTVIEGLCTKLRRLPLRNSCQVTIMDNSNRIYLLPLEKGSRVYIGRYYRFYLQIQDTNADAHPSQFLKASGLLGFEELDICTQKNSAEKS